MQAPPIRVQVHVSVVADSDQPAREPRQGDATTAGRT